MKSKYTWDEVQLNEMDCRDVIGTGDFQCDETDGFPTSLYYSFNQHIAWLEPNLNIVNNEDDPQFQDALQGCREWGVRFVEDESDVNEILKEIGGDALDYLLENE
jgi:hypothetical protein